MPHAGVESAPCAIAKRALPNDRGAWAGTTSRSRARCAQWILRSSSSTTISSSTRTPRMSFERSREVYDRHVGRYSSALARALDRTNRPARRRPRARRRLRPGALTEAFAARLGAANVAAVDPSGSFVDACPRARSRRGRAARRRGGACLPGRVVSTSSPRNSVVNFMADAPAGVREMTRSAGASSRPASGTTRARLWMLRRFWEAPATSIPPHRTSGDVLLQP
jgi:hypothetical protein